MYFLDGLSFWTKYDGPLAIIGALLAFAALAFAFVQFKDARHHTKDLKHLVGDLNVIKGELSTRFLAEFPYYISEINDVLESAQRELIIVCDVPGYSYFSDFKGWLDYHNIINQKNREGVKVIMICLTKEQRIERLKEQFGDINETEEENAWTKLVNDDKFQAKLKWFISLYDKQLHNKGHSKYTANEVKFNRFLELLEDANDNVIRNEFRGLDICETKTQLSVFFWIADGMKALFAIPRSGTTGSELGFKTSDEKLISALKSLVDGYKRNSEAVTR